MMKKMIKKQEKQCTPKNAMIRKKTVKKSKKETYQKQEDDIWHSEKDGNGQYHQEDINCLGGENQDDSPKELKPRQKVDNNFGHHN